MEVIKVKNYEQLSKKAAKLICDMINNKKDSVMCFATGSTPVGTFQEMVDCYTQKRVTFKNTKAFFLDEYCLNHPRLFEHSNKYFLEYNFFNKVNIEEKNIFGFDQNIQNADKTIAQMNERLAENPIDILILGIGENGHIGYNEPEDCDFSSTCHLAKLSIKTRLSQRKYFYDADEVPKYAITLGIADILKAKKIFLLASGLNKASAISKLLQEEQNTCFPASALLQHDNVTIIVDEAAASLYDK